MPFDTIIIKAKQARMLLALRNANQIWYISSIAKAADTTYVHACNFLIECEKLGLVASEKHGKSKSIKLTEKGMHIADYLNELYKALAKTNDSAKIPEEKKQ